MNLHDTVELTIASLAFGGDAVARNDGWVVFVRGALPGEKITAEIIEKKANFCRGKLLHILQPSPHRIASPCPYFPVCGGCQYLDLEYGAQLESKRQQVEDVLRRIGKVDFPPIKTIPCEEPFYYRNRVKLHVVRKEQEVQLGFIDAAGRKVIPIEHCKISDPAINSALAPVREQLKKSPLSKTVTLRVNKEGKVDFWTEDKPISKGMTLTECVRDKVFETPSSSFFQVHPVMTERLVETVESFLEPTSEALVDAYCGVGLFSVLFGKKIQQVIGIEEDQESVRWARKNMRANGLDTGVFYEGRVEAWLEKAMAKVAGKKRTVILDPPRDGCEKKVMQALKAARPEQIIYVSCNPPTLARDVEKLKEAYRVQGITLVDMFPQTMHCEVVGNLRAN